ncbi:MAG: calcium/sodium antiporter [Candidatus Neomarinimicrobiota bacterium]|nr:calcium/sodium antiporter [Candidatus Neomarinimicrobiota bacterium]
MTSPMITAHLVVGTILLYYGGEFVVKGASHIARLLGISRMVVGLTVVAFGTSLPELVVSLVAATSGKEEIAIGNIIGSNIANVGLIIGLSCSLFYISINGKRFLKDLNIMMAASALFILIVLDGMVERWEGVILFSGIILYTIYRLYSGQKETDAHDEFGTVGINAGLLVFGILGLYFGSNIFVEGAISLARSFGIAELVIGMTIVAYGTSLPELATSLVAASRKEGDISLGNIIGSNLFNIMCVVGPVAIISPLAADRSLLSFELPVMIAFSIALYPLVRVSGTVSRKYAGVLLLGYLSFIISLFVI